MRLSLVSALFLTAACTLPNGASRTNTNHNAVPTVSCDDFSSGFCAFVNSPVRLGTTPVTLASRKLPFFNTIDALEFVDAGSAKWTAPADTLTDGASIPSIFVKLIGAPTSREFVNAAAIHDAYCGIGNEEAAYYHTAEWQNVHRMFYDALRVGGTSPIKAKIMFAAVYIGGPRWNGSVQTDIQLRGNNAITAAAFNAIENQTTARGRLANKSLRSLGIPVADLQTQMKKAIAHIKANNPSISALEQYLISAEKSMISSLALSDAGTDTDDVSGIVTPPSPAGIVTPPSPAGIVTPPGT